MSLNINLIVTAQAGKLYDVLHQTPKRQRAEFVRTQATLGLHYGSAQDAEEQRSGKDGVITAENEAWVRVGISVTPSAGELYKALLELRPRQRAAYIRAQAIIGVHLRPHYIEGDNVDGMHDPLKINLTVPSEHALYPILRQMPKRQRAEYIRTQSVLGTHLRQQPAETPVIPKDNTAPVEGTDNNEISTADECSLEAFGFLF